MKTKYVIIISIFVILMSMTCISASENVNQTDSLGLSIEDNIETAENNQKIIRQTPDEVELKENKKQTMNSNILGISNSEESLGAPDDGTFKTLQEKINNTAEGDTLVLENDYANTDNFDKNGISISKSLTIDGNGYTIDALSKGRIFQVTASNVILKNINFVNGNSNSAGGAVYWNGADGVLNGSNFNGNNARYGGAVSWSGDRGVLSGSNFNGNNASMDGGAVSWSGDRGVLSGSNFNGNNASRNGGAVYWNSADGVLSGSNFTGNNASRGGAVYWNGDNSNINATFINNTAMNYGGAIYVNKFSASTVTGTYINNTGSGGTIFFINNDKLDVEIKNAIFLNNKCGYEISANSRHSDIVVNDCWFGNNASNFNDKPTNKINNVIMSNWLFLNATADHNSLLVMNSTNITFKLNSTNGQDVFEFDNSKLPAVNLALTATKGDVEKTTTLDDAVKYVATEYGKGSVTASIENAKHTIFFDNIELNPKFSAEVNPQVIDYGKNTTIMLSYNDTATGTVNITLTGKKHLQKIENVDLNKKIKLPNTILPDEYEVTVTYSGDKVFANASATSALTVNKLKSDIKVVGHDIYVNETRGLMFNVTLPGNATGNLSISNGTILNVTKEGRKENNSLIIKIMNNAYPIGKYEWTFTYSGDDIYESSEETSVANILIIPTAITANVTSKLFVDNTTQVSYNLTPDGAVGDIVFTSNDTGVVEVDRDGNIKAIAEGTALITVNFEGSENYTASSTNITITVSKIPTEINITNETVELKALQSIGGLATLNPAEAGNLTYTSSDEDIVLVSDDGIIYARIKGTATVTVSFAGDGKYKAAQNKTIKVTVTLNDARVSVENDTLDLFVDDTCIINATANPQSLTVNYTSSDESVATVTDYGNVKAVGEGTAVITLTVGNGETYAINYTDVKVTVSKVPTEITVKPDSLDLFVGDETVIIANLTPQDAGNVTFTSSDDSVVTVDNQGNVIAEGKGTAIITVSFAGDNKYAAAKNKTITVKVSLNDASVRVNNNTLNLLIDDTFTIVATTVPRGLNVTYMPDNSGIISIDENGLVTALKEGTAPIIVKVGGDGVYAENTTTVTVTVNKISTDISIANATVNLNVDDEVSTGAKLNPEEAGNLTYTSSDESVVVKDGKIIALKEGNAIITVSFKGNNKYGEAKNKTIKVTVKKLNPSMNITADEITEGENATINVELPIDATGNVTTTVNGKTYSSPVDNGKAIITIPDLEYGNYTLPVTYSGDDKYNPLTKDVNLTVKEDKIIVSAPDLTKYYSGHESFNVNVTYANGRAIAGKEVKITINGITYSRTTDENGSALLNINLNSATYDTVVEVDNITVNSLVTILPTIEAEDVESKSKNIVFSATFIDGEGNYLKDGTNVSFNVDGIIYNSQVIGDKGRASVDLVLNHGRYIITSYNSVSNENMSNSIAIDLKDADMTLSCDKISVGEKATIIVTLPSDATGNVTATINGKTYTNQVNNGKANIIIPDLSAGNYTAHVTYSGDNNYNHATGDVSVSVAKINPSIDIEDSVIAVGENATVIVILPSDATGDVRIGNEIVPLKEGSASVILTGLPVGITTIPVTYSGDDKYNPIETNADVVVNDVPSPDKKNLTIKATSDEITEGDNAVIIVTGLENATGNVSAVVHGHIHSAPIVDGTANITIKGLVENATAFVSYAGDDLYNPAVTSVNITVNKNTVNINAENLTKYYKDPQKFTVTVTDAKGQAAANKTVEITINGVTYTKITDENGTASLNINLNSGEYPVSVAVDDVVVNSSVFVKATIDASDVVKVFRNDTQYYATFVDVNGTPTPNTTVSFNVNGVIYNRTTDENGTAKLNINLPSGEYILTSTNTVTGEKMSNVIKVLSVIESSDLTKYFRNASQFIVRIHTADGGYVGAGEEVRFNINGMIYAKKTNATGHAKININLPQGLYTITTYYKDFSQGNTIEVLPILSAEDLSMKYMDGSQFKAQLVDGKGKPFPKQDVRFNINGVFYNRATDSDGVAKLNIRLLSGQYIITSSYNGCNIANKVTIKS